MILLTLEGILEDYVITVVFQGEAYILYVHFFYIFFTRGIGSRPFSMKLHQLNQLN